MLDINSVIDAIKELSVEVNELEKVIKTGEYDSSVTGQINTKKQKLRNLQKYAELCGVSPSEYKIEKETVKTKPAKPKNGSKVNLKIKNSSLKKRAENKKSVSQPYEISSCRSSYFSDSCR